MKIKWKILITSLIVVYLVAFLGSLFTSPNTDTAWYESIKPSITPPNWVFPIVWNILFFLIALSLYFAWIKAKKNQKTKITLVFGINFALNILWSILYFGMKNPTASFIEIFFLIASIISMIIVTAKVSKTASYLLHPYLIWVCFATILNYLTVQLI